MASETQVETLANVKAFDEIIETRRSVRLFEKEPIPEDIVQKCLDWALLAPTSSNLQCWEFYWVRTPEVKAALVKACLSQAAAATAAELIVCVARTNTWRRGRYDMLTQMEAHKQKGTNIPKAAERYYQKLVPFVYNQGPLGIFGLLKKIVFFFIGFVRPIARDPSSKKEMQIWAIKTSSLACENIMLGFRAFGYDTCPMEGFDKYRVKKALELPKDAVVTMVIGAGKRRPNGVTLPRIRGERSWFVKTV